MGVLFTSRRFITLLAAFLLTPLSALANGINEPVVIAPVIITPPSASWTGAYIGGSLAHATFSGTYCAENFADFSCVNGVTNANAPTPEPSGGMFGITAGYDWQMGNIVYGIAGDLMFGDLTASAPTSGGYNCVSGCGLSVSSIAILRGRVGYAVSDRLLPYVTMGVASTEVNVFINSNPPAVSDTATNQVIGFGTDYMATDNISVGFDYLHLLERPQHLGLGLAGTTALGATDFTADILRLNVMYRF